ncbi:hypothetical protein G7092_06365 [Mucilaginibacter sp. HC2]|uniref:dihydrofolate reductase family protein n=1 Tax=Mucilaginibacter inviolabilis TaxID=2714892 RepID=UPI00140DDA35|nr:dihydrofolate reductase [Mucilaginibacter inviolabilis]NHA03407.1 hypothetical protein [Mucilaginibacter inviolabilis]
MEFIIYASLTANGRVILAQQENYQTPVEILKDCMELAWGTGNMVIGSNTFNLFMSIPGAGEGLKGLELIVLSKRTDSFEGVTFLPDAESIIEYLGKKGQNKILILGGVQTYHSFINKGYVNELYLNYNPILTSTGEELLDLTDHDLDLELLGTKVITSDIFQLHWLVKK